MLSLTYASSFASHPRHPHGSVHTAGGGEGGGGGGVIGDGVGGGGGLGSAAVTTDKGQPAKSHRHSQSSLRITAKSISPQTSRLNQPTDTQTKGTTEMKEKERRADKNTENKTRKIKKTSMESKHTLNVCKSEEKLPNLFPYFSLDNVHTFIWLTRLLNGRKPPASDQRRSVLQSLSSSFNAGLWLPSAILQPENVLIKASRHQCTAIICLQESIN